MHEMGIACSILEAVEKERKLHPGCRPYKVAVRIGQFAGVDGDSLQFCFDAMVNGSAQAPLELQVEPALGDELDIAWLEMDEPEPEERSLASVVSCGPNRRGSQEATR